MSACGATPFPLRGTNLSNPDVIGLGRLVKRSSGLGLNREVPGSNPTCYINEANARDRQELGELPMNGMRTVGGSLTMRRAGTVLALQRCCGCVVRRFTSDIGGGVVSEEACKWNCVSVQRSARAIVKAETQNMNAGIHNQCRV